MPRLGGLAVVHFLFVGLDFNLLMLNVETQAVVNAHVLVGDPDEREKRNNVSAPVHKKKFIARDEKNSRRDIVAETIFASEQIKEFAAERRSRAECILV